MRMVCQCGHERKFHGILSGVCTGFDCKCIKFVLAPKIRAVVSRRGVVQEEEVGTDHLSMQVLVGGPVEHKRLRNSWQGSNGSWEGLHLWYNMLGLVEKLPETQCPMYGPIAGDYFLTRLDERGEMQELSPSDVAHIMTAYARKVEKQN